MVSFDRIQEVRKAYDEVLDEISNFLSKELSTCSLDTVKLWAKDAWNNASVSEQKIFTKSCWIDLHESISYLKIISGYNYEGQELGWTLPFEALEPGWIREQDLKIRAELAQKQMRAENAIIAKQKASHEADKAKRRQLYEELRKEFANEV